jgi:hypothetical protein
MRADKDLEKEIAELQKQRALEEGRLASFGTASGDFDNDLYGGSSSRGGTLIFILFFVYSFV